MKSLQIISFKSLCLSFIWRKKVYFLFKWIHSTWESLEKTHLILFHYNIHISIPSQSSQLCRLLRFRSLLDSIRRNNNKRNTLTVSFTHSFYAIIRSLALSYTANWWNLIYCQYHRYIFQMFRNWKIKILLTVWDQFKLFIFFKREWENKVVNWI